MTKYNKAIEWVAFNDEPRDINIESISEMISVGLISDVFNKTPERVAMDVYELRTKYKTIL